MLSETEQLRDRIKKAISIQKPIKAPWNLQEQQYKHAHTPLHPQADFLG